MKKILTAILALIMLFPAIISANASEYMVGDVNNNGGIDSLDYILLKRAYFGTFNLDDNARAAGDINGNGDIDSVDYVLVKRMYFGTYSLNGDVSVNIDTSGWTVEDFLNKAPLNPMKTNCEAVDSLVDDIFARIHTPDMNTYQKVKACFDYLVDECEYASAGFAILDPSVLGDNSYTSYYDMMVVINAYTILSTKEGVCDNYSSAFVVMCRRIGLDIHLTGGTVSTKSGGRTGHAWTYMTIYGKTFIFDPQVQDNNPNAPYFFFGKTYEEMGDRYEPSADTYDASDFGDFQVYRIPDYNINVELSIEGGQEPFIYSTSQNGNSLNSGISGLMGDGLVTDEHGRIHITVNPTGGSGSYIFGVLCTDNTDSSPRVICEKPITGATTVTIDYTTFLIENDPLFHVVIMDAVNNDSYITIEGIKIVFP